MCKWEEYNAEVIKLYHWLHQHPELSMEETETSRFILKYLKDLAVPCRMAGETGVIGTLMVNPSYPTLAVRAEIDGLPIQEETKLSYASIYPGKMHGCGHDANTAVVLCLAKVLTQHREQLKYNIRFLFEPGEETGQGARHMIAHGGLENPKVDEILIFHFGNQDTRRMEIQKSITTAAVGKITLRIKGKSSHWFQPEKGIDALYAAARLSVEIHHLNEMLYTEHPFVLGFGLMQAGTAGNIVADSGCLKGSIRAFTMKDFRYIWEKLEETIGKIEKETGARIEVEPGRMIPPIINDSKLVERGTAIGKELMKDRFLLGEQPFLVGDNAAFYMEQIPGMRTVFLAGKQNGENYPVHNPKFDIDETVLSDALKFLYKMSTTGR